MVIINPLVNRTIIFKKSSIVEIKEKYPKIEKNPIPIYFQDSFSLFSELRPKSFILFISPPPITFPITHIESELIPECIIFIIKPKLASKKLKLQITELSILCYSKVESLSFEIISLSYIVLIWLASILNLFEFGISFSHIVSFPEFQIATLVTVRLLISVSL